MKKINKTIMKTACLWANMSRCNNLKVGCVIAKNKRIISTGYNGTLKGDSNKCECDKGLTLNSVMHAEQNALIFCAKNGLSTKNCELFTTVSPCEFCARLIISSGIKAVYYKNQYRNASGLTLLKRFNIKTIKIS